MSSQIRRRGAAWLGAYRSHVPEVQTASNRAARITDRYSRRGRPVPFELARHWRSTLADLIEQHHHLGDAAIRAARFAIDAIDANQQRYRCPVCAAEMCEQHDHLVFDAVCEDCCLDCLEESA